MSDIIEFQQVKRKILTIRNQNVILDRDVAALYGVATMRINEAVKNNPEKFPEGYIIELTKSEKQEVIENFDNLACVSNLKFSPKAPKAFTEKGLYMLATILKSQKATQTTIAIVETFTKIRELATTITQLSLTPSKTKQKSLIRRSGKIMGEILDNDFQVRDTETSLEINFALMKFKHVIKQRRKK